MKLLRSNPFKRLPPLLAAWKLKHCAVIRFLLDSSLHSVLHTARAQGAVSMEGGIRKQRVLTSAPGPKVNGWAAPQQDEVNHSQESNPFSRLTALGFGCLQPKVAMRTSRTGSLTQHALLTLLLEEAVPNKG